MTLQAGLHQMEHFQGISGSVEGCLTLRQTENINNEIPIYLYLWWEIEPYELYDPHINFRYASFWMGLPHKKYPPKNKISQSYGYLLSICWNIGAGILAKFGLTGVAMARHGLKLWENDAKGLKIILKI